MNDVFNKKNQSSLPPSSVSLVGTGSFHHCNDADAKNKYIEFATITTPPLIQNTLRHSNKVFCKRKLVTIIMYSYFIDVICSLEKKTNTSKQYHSHAVCHVVRSKSECLLAFSVLVS